MRIAIIEDNPAEAEVLARQTETCAPFVCTIGKADIYACAADFLAAGRYYDLILIDCLLPDMSGVELAKEIRKTNADAAFIFTTAYLEYAAEGYETDALRYLLKPVSEAKLTEALTFFARRAQEDISVELTGSSKHPAFVRSSRIMYVEAVGRGVVVRTEDGSMESRRSLDHLEKELGDVYFFRTQRRFLVGFRYIEKKEDDTLVIRGGERVKISRRRLPAFHRALTRYMELGKQTWF